MKTEVNTLGASFGKCQQGESSSLLHKLRARLHGGGGPQVGEVTRLGGVTHLFK